MPGNWIDGRISMRLDDALAAADRHLAEDNEPQRPETVHDDLKELFGSIDLKRLSYRPQPHSSTFAAPEVLREPMPEEEDVSFQILIRSAKRVLPNRFWAKLERLSRELRRQGIMFLTLVDAAACLPEKQWSWTVKEAVSTIYALNDGCREVMESLWYQYLSDTDGPDEKARIIHLTRNARAYVLVVQLTSFVGRLEGKLMAEVDADVERNTSALGVPPNFDIFDELEQLELRIETNQDECLEAFEDGAQMEWRGEPIPVENVSAPIEGLTDADCAVCQDALTPPGVVTACQHSYCRTHLEQWIHAARENSHLCCICRKVLFPKPNYRIKSPEGGRNYQHEMEWWDRALDNVCVVKHLASWLEQERQLQITYE
ncbi:hypothetical protein J4E83_000868 [Alternaria metachromatica]|uniref:uncharacterized protein n=1 Tax=Alternaria metachromatica TaxID=283354 RepID=UPI0020C4F5DE|nr:uncharacterized protein J4E83_000868 [Alternaria metachromatica]KAI4635914.1 hypothetical protein J4E83_000868 [Alternaria metachromatica]